MPKPPWELNLNKTGKMNKEVMHRNLLDFNDTMTRFGVKHVLIFGGLLGLIREGKLIDYDDDVEFACFSPDHRKMKKVIEKLKEKGFTVVDRNECPLHDHFFIRDGEKIEIWWFDKVGNEYIYDNRIRYPSKFFDTLEDIAFLIRRWKIPSNPEEFLEITYGKGWRVPDPKGRYIL